MIMLELRVLVNTKTQIWPQVTTIFAVKYSFLEDDYVSSEFLLILLEATPATDIRCLCSDNGSWEGGLGPAQDRQLSWKSLFPL